MLIGAAKRPGIHPDMLTALAKRVAQNRTVAGLHYPLDSEAGLKAAEKVFAMLMSNKPKCQKFRDLLEAAQKESKLPPKKQAEAMQELTRDMPAKYRDVIEAYFRKLAQSEASRP